MEKVLFKTKSLDITETTFEVVLSDINFNSAKVKVTPSDGSALYFVNVFSEEHYQYFGGNEEAFVNQLLYVRDYYLGKGATIEQMIANLAVAGERELVFEDLVPNTKYYAYAIGIDRDFFANTEAEVKEFSSLSADASGLSFEFSLTEVTYEGIVGTVTPSNGCYYFLDWCDVESFTAKAKDLGSTDAAAAYFIEEEIAYGAEWFGGSRIEYLTEMGAILGTAVYPIQDLMPDTEYLLMVMPIDLTTGEIAAEKASLSDPFRTENKIWSDAVVNFEFGDIYDGSVLAELDPANFLQCTGYAVMPYKVVVNATAVNWYTQFYPFDMSEWEMTDEGIYDELITYGYEWDPESVSLNRTEGMAVMEWETVFTFLGIAEDAEGNFGHGVMETLTARKDQVAPAEELLEQLATPARLARPAHKSPLQAQQRKPHGLKR